MICVGVGGGLRRFEICSLNLEDIDVASGVLRVTAGKGRKGRQLFLSEQVLAKLATWIDCRGPLAGPLFTRIHKNGNISSERISTSGLSHAIKSIQQDCNIDAFTLHDMRRTFITKLLEDNVDINTVRQLAGHNDISTTTKYDMRGIQQQKQASQRLTF